jgi:hypothetical protein
MLVKYLVAKEIRRPSNRAREFGVQCVVDRVDVIDSQVDSKRGPQRREVPALRRLVARNAERVRIGQPNVDTALARRGNNGGRATWSIHLHGVEERPGLCSHINSATPQALCEDCRIAMHACSNIGQAVGSVIDGIHRRCYRKQDLRSAYVACCLLAPDVLLTGLQCEPVGGPTVGVDRLADRTTWEPRIAG